MIGHKTFTSIFFKFSILVLPLLFFSCSSGAQFVSETDFEEFPVEESPAEEFPLEGFPLEEFPAIEDEGAGDETPNSPNDESGMESGFTGDEVDSFSTDESSLPEEIALQEEPPGTFEPEAQEPSVVVTLPEAAETPLDPPQAAVEPPAQSRPMEQEQRQPAQIPPTQPPVQSQPPPQVQRPPAQQPSQPPDPPSFLGPAEPQVTPPSRQEITVPVNPVPDAPSRIPIETTEGDVVFSRVVRATVGQLVEIPFRGSGWVYLGELGNRRGVEYSSRRLDIEAGSAIGQTFIFTADIPGTYILKFYKQDFIQDFILIDYVQVIVGERRETTGPRGVPTGRDRVIAEPRWPPAQSFASEPVSETGAAAEAVASPEAQVSGTQASGAQAPGAQVPGAAMAAESERVITPQEMPVPPHIEAEAEYIRRTQLEFDAGRVEAAIAVLDSMKKYYPLGSAEALWLYGQLLEASSPARNIRLALECYQRLIREFPQSSLVPNARRRISYLERYYLNIR